ncbi:hypothetical protein RN001_008895 [Aquatica leii]|uniref:C2H2-type domain-containing protein n=1 Tax=Aquatica leii TaxID=1421715 RepID=A0AAN7PAX1_9COLE|nr:hypothetical protein RN001_008895 [Aquatica leii]
MNDKCLLCRAQINNLFCTNYNVDLNFTKCTNKLLREYLTDTCKNNILISSNSLICNNCKNLIDDLDYAENSYKEIRKTVWSYLGYDGNIKCSVYCQTGSDEIVKYKFEPDFESKLVRQEHINTHNINENIKQEVSIKDDIQNLSTDVGINIEQTFLLNTSRERKKRNVGASKPYQCTTCLKTWKTLGELKSHQSSHSDVRPFICEICGQSYKQKTALDIHVGMHNGIYPFMCMYCKKTFTQKGALHRHLPIHTGDTPYQCDLCGKRFVHHTSFNIHQLSHTGQKDYKCSQCGRALLSASHLKRHMRVHTGEKKYVCTLCDKRFAERYNLVSHQKLHEKTADSTYKRNHRCPLCTETFNRRLKLDEHMVQEHQKIE